jgi:predicted DNA-binding transcriptional regulator AlpA
VAPIVDTADLVGPAEVARILGLSRANSVATYRARYPDFPKPVVDLPESRVRLWLRREIDEWDNTRSHRRGRPPGGPNPRA